MVSIRLLGVLRLISSPCQLRSEELCNTLLCAAFKWQQESVLNLSRHLCHHDAELAKVFDVDCVSVDDAVCKVFRWCNSMTSQYCGHLFS